MSTGEPKIVPIFRTHARSGNHFAISAWFFNQKDCEDYPDDDWVDRVLEERRGVVVEDHLYVMSDHGLHNPDND